MPGRMLIAGVGNIFLGDDGFGVEVTRRLAREALPEWVRVADFGIRGLHLAFDILDGGYDATVLVDATARGGAPGTVYLIEPDLDGAAGAPADAHTMTPEAVFAALNALGANPGRVFIVGCEPASLDENIGLSGPVARAVDEALHLVRSLIARNGA